jgi:hypothetical protein
MPCKRSLTNIITSPLPVIFDQFQSQVANLRKVRISIVSDKNIKE